MPSPSRLILPDGGIVELQESCTLGRDTGNTVSLADNHVSKFHAIIQTQSEGECWLVDLGSSNGTHLNGRRLTRPHVLGHGDVIELGGNQIVFETDRNRIDEPDGMATGTVSSTIVQKRVRNLWLMVADIANATRMVRELPAEQVAKDIGEWFKNCRKLLETHGAHMNQYTGDGFLCYWEDTLDIKTRIIGAMRELAVMQANPSLPFRFVIHHGKTLLGGVPTLSALTLHGESVHFVFRMEKLAGKWGDSILCSEAALNQLKLKPLLRRESEAGGFNGVFQFFVPDLES